MYPEASGSGTRETASRVNGHFDLFPSSSARPGGGRTRTGALVSLLVQHSVSGGGKGWPPWPGPDPRGEPAGLHRGL